MNYIKRFLLITFPVLLLAAPIAQGAEYDFDRAHSSFRFGVQHIYSTVYGHFDTYSGKVMFDPAKPADSSFQFTVKVKSIQTGIVKRDKHLLSNDFFTAGKYPEITFTSSSVKHTGGNNYAVAGTLQMKDVKKEVVLPVVYWGSKVHPMDKSKKVAGFDFKLRVDRLAYNVGNGKFHKMGLVGKDVDIFASLEMMTGN